MFLFRQLAEILRGSAAPIQMVMACVMGCLIGFVPGGFDHAGLMVAWILLLIVLNANLGVALAMAAGAKVLSLALMSVSFGVGRWLLEGPAEAAVAWANDAPLLALLDLEYYAVTGGIVMAAAIGLVTGIVMVVVISGFRKKFAGLEEGSERYQKLNSKRSVRFLLWLIVGKGHGKKTYGELLTHRDWNPVRKSGAVVVAVLIALFLFVPDLLSGPFLTSAARDGLASGNGATVDLAGLTLDTKAGRLVLEGLAMADSALLENDVLRAVNIEADGSMDDLLRGRLALDRVVVIQGKNNVLRSSPGILVGAQPGPVDEPDDAPTQTGAGGSLDDYLSDAEEWKERLDQVREWLDKLSSDEDGDGGHEGETLEERLAREVAEGGYANVFAEHLTQVAPAFMVHEIIADGLDSTYLPGDLLDVRVTNFSTAPALSDDPLRMTMQSQSGAFDAEFALGGSAAAPGDNVVRFSLAGLAVDSIASSLAKDGKAPLQGGTLDLSMDGSWAEQGVGFLDLPLAVTLRGVTVDLPGGSRVVDGVTLMFQISGPIDDPSISFDDGAFTELLLAGARAQVDEEIDRRKDELQGELDAKQAELQGELDAKQAEAEDELKSKAKGLLGGLFGDDDDGGDD